MSTGWLEALRTPLWEARTLEGRERKGEVVRMRMSRIEEAVGWKPGTVKKPRKYTVDELPGGEEVYFLKPGREVARRRGRNPHDMTPLVGANPEWRPTFVDVWEALLGLEDEEVFKAVLVLIYRSAYMLDHGEVKGGYRYRPDLGVVRGLEERAGSPPRPFPGLLGLLHFLDLLGWNEDVKYHARDDESAFRRRFDVGRVNTLLTCIRVPCALRPFKLPGTNSGGLRPLLGVCYDFLVRRGTTKPRQEDLVGWMSPYLHKAQTGSR